MNKFMGSDRLDSRRNTQANIISVDFLLIAVDSSIINDILLTYSTIFFSNTFLNSPPMWLTMLI
jgi:hypothetical protein